MTLLAVLDEYYSVTTEWRFSGLNPWTRRPYAHSLFRDLPEYAAEVVTDVVGLTPAQWDALVEAGEAYGAVGERRAYSLARWRGRCQQRDYRNPPQGRCGDCFGTGVTDDYDGSMTGTVGTVYLCNCTGC